MSKYPCVNDCFGLQRGAGADIARNQVLLLNFAVLAILKCRKLIQNRLQQLASCLKAAWKN